MSVRFVQYLKASGLMTVVVSETFTLVRALQLRKASFSIVFTFEGTSKLVNPQSAKAPLPIFSISDSGSKVTVAMLEHPLKAFASIVVTVFGKLKVLSSVRLRKALLLICFNSQLPRKLKALSLVLVMKALLSILCSLEPSGMFMVSKSGQR